MSEMRRLFPAILIAAFGCQAWHPVQRPTTGGSLPDNPEVVRVTRTFDCGPTPSRECVASRGTVTLHNPRIQGDSLIGYYDRGNYERAAMHMRDVVSIESREVDPARTVGAALGVGALVGIGVVIALIALLAGSY